MRQIKHIFQFLTLLLAAGSLSNAQTASHTATVRVSTITALQVSSGTVNLSITGALVVAGQDLMTTSNQTTSLRWGVNSSSKKITVRTSLAAPKYTLKIEAASPTQGLSAGTVTVATLDRDLLLNIGRSSGTCTLAYTGEALASQGAGTDAHTITFTVVTQ
jgi:hypothetical protein